jgi:hypothetical protein
VVASNVDDVAFFDNLVEFSTLLFLDKSGHAYYLDTLKLIMPVWLDAGMLGAEKRPLISGFYKMARLGLVVLTTERRRTGAVREPAKRPDVNGDDRGYDTDEESGEGPRVNGGDVEMEDGGELVGPLDDESYSEKVRAFVSRVLVRCPQYTDELLLACLRMICAVPTTLVESSVDELVALMKVSLVLSARLYGDPKFTVAFTLTPLMDYVHED